MSTWHVADDDLRAYAAGTAGVPVAASVEAHVVRCAGCAAALAPAVETTRLAAIWAEVEDRVDAPPPTRLERLLRAAGVPATDARLLAATPSLRGGWFAALAVVLALALGATFLSGGGEPAAFLLLAPLLPVAGVAAAFGRHIDPAYELTIAAPYSTLRLLLLRTASVVTTCVALTGAVALLLPDAAAPAAWLLPALGLTLATLALATWWEPGAAAVATGGGWVVVVTEMMRRREAAALEGAGVQVACALLAVVAAVVLAGRRRHFDQEGIR